MRTLDLTRVQLAEQLQEVEVVRVVTEDGLTFVPTGAHVKPATGSIEAQCACHALIEPGEDHRVKDYLSK